ncbi:MAG: DUF3306 domain-containing protein [Rhodomicrobiaceae bacterium]
MTENEKTVEETFLKRWSRRKQTDEAELTDPSVSDEKSENREREQSNEISASEKEAEEKEMVENREAAEAINLETLNYESDFGPFMKKGVPEVLKNLAMRKLWTSNPILANVDGLNDYDENFADPALNVFKSNWKVGRGFLTEEDDEKERLRKLALEEDQNPKEESASESEEADIEDQLSYEQTPEEIDEVQREEVAGELETQGQDTDLDENPIEEYNSENITHAERELEEVAPSIKRVSIRKRLLDN